MRRRNFLAGTTALVSSIICSNLPARTVTGSCRRKNILDLAPDSPEILLYKQAVALMKGLSPTDKRYWKNQASLHSQFCPHTNWWFLPWHRAYLYYFEQICRDVLQHADFALPYWDWTRYPYLPDPFLDESSPLWDSGRAQNGTVAVSLKSIWRPEINKILGNSDIGQMYGNKPAETTQVAHSIPGELESVPHGAVHSAVGGDMWSGSSPLDPIFWLHHCNVDRLWESWAVLHGWGVPADTMWADRQLVQFYDPIGKQMVNVQCGQTVNSALFGAQYDRLEILEGYLPPPILPTLQILFGPGGEVFAPPGVIVEQALFTQAHIIGNNTIFDLEIPDDLDTVLDNIIDAWREDRPQKLPSAFLLLNEVPVPAFPGIMLRIFVNVKDPANAPVDDAGYITMASFFGHFDHHNKDRRTADFSFNITSAIARLGMARRRRKGKLNITVSTAYLNPDAEGKPDPVLPAKLRIVGLK